MGRRPNRHPYRQTRLNAVTYNEVRVQTEPIPITCNRRDGLLPRLSGTVKVDCIVCGMMKVLTEIFIHSVAPLRRLKMANRDDIDRLLAICSNCSAVYAARQWPDGDIQAIGSDGCRCGSDDFDPIEVTN